jgi:phosphate:Na+ symporter
MALAGRGVHPEWAWRGCRAADFPARTASIAKYLRAATNAAGFEGRVMEADIFKDVLVPVIGGLGIFMLGLEFMANGIQALAVNKMRAFLARTAGTPIKGLAAGTLITGVIQSSTAMTVMVVGLVNAGILGLRPAISVIMGANIGTTLGNGLIALPLGPIGLILAGAFALLYVFARSDRVRNIALACMGFALIFYGLNLMTGGLKPLRNMPEVMSVISALNADTWAGLVWCVLTAALITAMIHSSSATIGIVVGLGAAGVLDWQTSVACALGADLGTTITSWMASLNLSKNAKRAAYAHIAFNFIGVAVMLPLFYVSMDLLVWIMGWFGGHPGTPVVIDGKETFPLVPVAVGLYSTVFNIFNTALMFPFLGVFHRVLSKVGHSSIEDREDYTQPRYLDERLRKDFASGVACVQRESGRYLEGAAQLMAIARDADNAPDDAQEHYEALDVLSREIRSYTPRCSSPTFPTRRLTCSRA